MLESLEAMTIQAAGKVTPKLAKSIGFFVFCYKQRQQLNR